jgi:hypothetical protein
LKECPENIGKKPQLRFMNDIKIAMEEMKVPAQRCGQVEQVISEPSEEATEESLIPMSIVCYKLMAMGRE